jgi:alpha-L-fucosidase 2
VPLPDHGVHYTTPATTWDEALPLGNGILGALVWGDGKPLKISLDRTDLWDLRPVPEYHSADYTYKQMVQWHREGKHAELIRLYEDPYSRPESPTKIPAGRIELTFGDDAAFSRADLSIADAVASVELKPGVRVQVLTHATQPIGIIRVRGTKTVTPKLIAPPFGGKGSLGKLGYPPPVETSGETWQAFTQQGWQGFAFAVHLAWRQSGDEWLGVWSVASKLEGDDAGQIARERVEAALKAGADALLPAHQQWWQAYWKQSSITVPNKVVERQWYLDQYKFGAASRRGSPPITLQGPWTADDGELPPWKGDYHHDLNTQLSYWPCYSANHLDEGLSYLDWLFKTRDHCTAWTKRFFDMPGMNVPMTADLNNEQIGGWRQYTHSATTACWLAQHFYLHWRYSMDREFLRNRAYPYLKDAATFIEAVTANKDANGKRCLRLSASPEMHDNKPEAWFENTMTNYDLALVRWLLSASAELADELQLADDAKHWRAVLAEMPDYAYGNDGRLLVAPNHPLPFSHRHFSHLMAIHPLGSIDWADGEAAQRTIRANLTELDKLGTDWWCGYSFAWLANLAAHAHEGERAERALETFATAFTLRNSFHCNGDQSGKGLSKFTYRPFTLEGNFAAAAGLQEMLLQSHRGEIVVFPAVPDAWKDVAFTTLRAQGAFLVSARRVNGKVKELGIVAEKGGTCRVLSPFTGKHMSFPMQPGEHRVISSDAQ